MQHTMKNHSENPFDDAWQYVAANDGGAAEALAKLYLSIWNHYDHPYPLAECIPPLDSERLLIARSMVGHYIKHGKSESACRHAKDILAKYPKFQRRKTEADSALGVKTDIVDLLWKLKCIAHNLGTAVARRDFADAHAEAGRLADTIEHYEKTHPDHTV